MSQCRYLLPTVLRPPGTVRPIDLYAHKSHTKNINIQLFNLLGYLPYQIYVYSRLVLYIEYI